MVGISGGGGRDGMGLVVSRWAGSEVKWWKWWEQRTRLKIRHGCWWSGKRTNCEVETLNGGESAGRGLGVQDEIYTRTGRNRMVGVDNESVDVR